MDITGIGLEGVCLWGITVPNGEVFQSPVNENDWQGGGLPNGERAVKITGEGYDPAGYGDKYGYWGVITESGKVFIRTIKSSTWTELPLPTGEEAAEITGNGVSEVSNGYYNGGTFAVTTKSGRVFQALVGYAQWDEMSLPNEEQAAMVAGKGTQLGVWAAISKSGKVYQRTWEPLADAVNHPEIDRESWETHWVESSLPNGEKAVYIAGSGDVTDHPEYSPGYDRVSWLVITATGKIFEKVIGNEGWKTNAWVERSLPSGEEAVLATGDGKMTSQLFASSANWGVIAKSGRVYEGTAGGAGWSEVDTPLNEKAIAIAGYGITETYWGIITSSGGVLQIQVKVS